MKRTTISLKDLCKKDLPPIEYYVDKLIMKRGITYLYGPAESFKSGGLMYMCIKGSRGEDFLNFKIEKPFRTLWIDEEMDDSQIKDKAIKLCKGEQCNVPSDIHIVQERGFSIMEKTDIAELERLIKELKVNVVVMDSFAHVFYLNEKDEQLAKHIPRVLKPLIKKYGVSFVFIHHTRKRRSDQGVYTLEDMSGSRELGAHSDTAFSMEGIGPDTFLITAQKVRNNKHPDKNAKFKVLGEDKMIIEFEGVLQRERAFSHEKVAAKMLGWMVMHPQDTYCFSDIAKGVGKGVSSETVRKAINHNIEQQNIYKVKRDTYKLRGV